MSKHRGRLYIALLIVIHLLFLLPLTQKGFYQSHDGEVQVARFAAYYKSFLDGHIPPRWAGDLNYTYGSPVLNFYYPLPGYLASLLHTFSISFQDAFKILVAVSFIGAPLTFYIWIRKLVSEKTALLSSILYGLAPYHFLNLYVRGDIAEMLALVFVPLVLWTIDKRHFLTGGLFYGLLILSHNGISLMFTPILLAYTLIFTQNYKMKLIGLSVFAIGLGIAAFFWLPALFEMRYTLGNIFIGDMFRHHFPTLMQLVYSPWGFGPDVQKPGGLSPQTGPISFLLASASILLLKKSTNKSSQMLFWFSVFAISIFLTLSISAPLWTYVPLLSKFQFPWRFSALTSFAAATLSGFVLSRIHNTGLLVILLTATLFLAYPMTKIEKITDYPDSHYLSFPGTTYFHGETITKWSSGDAGDFPKQPIEIISGIGTVNDFKRSTVKHTLTVQSEEHVTILDNTFYYPGWRVYVNGNLTPIEFQNPNHRGLITFNLTKGTHDIRVEFQETVIRKIANAVSIVSIFGIILLWLFHKKIRILRLLT